MDYRIFNVCTNVNAFDCTRGRGGTDTERVCTECWLWEENPLPHRRIEPVSAAWRSDALTKWAISHPFSCLLSRVIQLHFPPRPLPAERDECRTELIRMFLVIRVLPWYDLSGCLDVEGQGQVPAPSIVRLCVPKTTENWKLKYHNFFSFFFFLLYLCQQEW